MKKRIILSIFCAVCVLWMTSCASNQINPEEDPQESEVLSAENDESAVQEAMENDAEEAAEDVAEEIAKETNEGVAEEAVENAAEEITEEATKGSAEGATEKVTGKTTEGIVEEVAKETTEGVTEKATEDETEILKFVDVYGQQYETEISSIVEKHIYDWTKLIWDGDRVSYEDEIYTSRLGIDVSYYQGDIDWEKVKEDGVTFAFIRIGYRGYGESGTLCEDQKALENIKEAKQAGIDVGVYFFSQAVNEEEALEEAEFVIEKLQGIELELPVVYDPESILDAEARTDNVSGEQFTKNTIVFCERIREAGYEAMIYSNMLWEAFEFQLEELSDLEIWYADYEKVPQTPYHFTFWQYSNAGSIDGINGTVDLDIQILKK